jgi:hypothetical protein
VSKRSSEGSWKQRDCVRKDIKVGKIKGRERPSNLVKTWQFTSPKEKDGCSLATSVGQQTRAPDNYLNWDARMH